MIPEASRDALRDDPLETLKTKQCNRKTVLSHLPVVSAHSRHSPAATPKGRRASKEGRRDYDERRKS